MSDIEAENRRLTIKLNAEHLVRQNAEAENAKLRELVRHLRECTKHNTCALCDYAEGTCDFDYDMRELGIEVDA